MRLILNTLLAAAGALWLCACTHAFLPEKDLRALFDPVGALSADSVITYCGGGVAASSNALALTLLGGGDVAVYDGGLIEWTSDPELPMEAG